MPIHIQVRVHANRRRPEREELRTHELAGGGEAHRVLKDPIGISRVERRERRIEQQHISPVGKVERLRGARRRVRARGVDGLDRQRLLRIR
jgi:hypothetical protein